MAEAARVRPVEYYNPRPLILGICFLWGLIVGFGLNFFQAPEQPPEDQPTGAGQTSIVAKPVSSELERRRQDIPNVAEVEPPAPAAIQKQRLEDMTIEPPTAALTTEGGLTGRTAQPLAAPARGQAAPSLRPTGPPPAAEPPPLPELNP